MVEAFLLQVSGNKLANALFQLAICGGSLAVPQNLVPKDKMSTTSEPTHREDKATTPLPSEGIYEGRHVFGTRLFNVHAHALLCLAAQLKQFIKDSLSSQKSTFTLAHMTSLEKKLTKHFQVKDFLSLQKGTFLEFLVKHTQVKKKKKKKVLTWTFLQLVKQWDKVVPALSVLGRVQLLQDILGSVVFLGTADGGLATIQDVFEFIKQCGCKTPTDPDEVSHINGRAVKTVY